MVVVGTPPNTTRAEDQDSENPHEPFGDAGMGQNSLVLLIVINDEKPEKQQASEYAAGELTSPMKVPDGPGHGGQQKNGGGKNVGPTFRRKINRERFGRQYNVFTCSHARFDPSASGQFLSATIDCRS